jgi:YesN/AraC family two-component response regulator
MINILVVEDDIIQLKQIINYISQKNEDIKLYGLTYSGEEALKLLMTGKIDIIILDLKLDGMSGVDVIKYIESKKIEKYKKSIIIVSGEYNMIKYIYTSIYVYEIFLKPFNLYYLNKSIEDIIYEKKYTNEIKEKIRKELDLLNFNFTHEGSKYLLECIYQVYTLEYIDDMNLSKIIYPILAKRYKKTVNTIYGNIKQAINSMFDNCPKKVLKNYFNFNCLIKPRPKEVIYTILNKINN